MYGSYENLPGTLYSEVDTSLTQLSQLNGTAYVVCSSTNINQMNIL